MDTAVVAAAASFAGSLVAQRCADAFVEQSWQRLRGLWDPTHAASAGEPLPLASRKNDAANDAELTGIASDLISRSVALRRALLVRSAVHGARVLWVDDNPDWNRFERQTFEALGANVAAVGSTAAALSKLTVNKYDLIISDMDREGNSQEGAALLGLLRAHGHQHPLIFYVMRLDPNRDRPYGSTGIANRPDELLHLVLDVLERHRL